MSRKIPGNTVPAAGSLEPIIFSELPFNDTCWALATGPDDRIYVGVCGEQRGGLGVVLAQFDPETRTLAYVADVPEVTGQPTDNGRPTQGKIHYCLMPSRDGCVYAATHCTSPPWGHPMWRPWNTWAHPTLSFPGSALIRYRPATDEAEYLGVIAPNEGSRAMVLDDDRRRLYGITYPRNHVYWYRLDTGERRDLGRIGTMNPQCIFKDPDGRIYTSDDYGHIVRYDPDQDELAHLDVQIPHAPFRDGTVNNFYDVAPTRDGRSIYACTWSFDARLFRYDMYDGPEGKMTDLGHAYGPDDPQSACMEGPHQVGGIIVADDGYLYFGAHAPGEHERTACLIRCDPETFARELVSPFQTPERTAFYISRCTRDRYGTLYFAECNQSPTAVWVYRPEGLPADYRVGSEMLGREWG